MRVWGGLLARLARCACACTLALPASLAGCHVDVPPVNWTCDYDASESRPTSEPDAAIDDAGHLAPSECQNTCGTPVTSCVATTLDGGASGAICPVCTF
jgi:hypothetical protein